MIIEGSDYSKQGEVKRTIVDLIDVENGEFVNAIDILTEEKYRDKAVFAKMKETLVLAQKIVTSPINVPLIFLSTHGITA